MQENQIKEWQQQQGASSPKRLEGSDTLERAGDQERSHDLAWLIAEELRRKDAHIARLESLLQQQKQTAAMPMEHLPRPESFAPSANDPQDAADLFGVMPPVLRGVTPSLRGGAMAYDMPSMACVADAAPPTMPVAGDTPPILSMVYDAPPVVPQPARIRLADMHIEPSPVAHTVMQARMQRLTEEVPAVDPTLRLEAPPVRRNHALARAADNGHARRNRMAAGLAFLAFAGTIGVLQTREGRQKPSASALASAPDASAQTGRKYLLNAPTAVSPQARPLEILPAEPAPIEPAPGTGRHPAHSARASHIAVVLPAAHRTNPLPYAAPAHHAAPSRLSAVAPPVHRRSSVASAAPAQTAGIRVEPSDKPVHDHQTLSRPPMASAADTMTASAEVPPDNTPDTSEDNSAYPLPASHRRHYRRYAAEANERRGRGYKYGENARRSFDYDAEFARHPAPGYDEKADAWIDKLPR